MLQTETRIDPLRAPERDGRLHARLEACVRRAQATGHPALLRLHARLTGDMDPWATWAATPAGQAPFFVLHDGRDGLAAAAWGERVMATLPRENRFAAARGFCSRLLEHTVDVAWDPGARPDGDAPWAFASFAFAGHGDDPAWQGWGGGCVYVPDVLVYRRAGVTSAVLTESVTGGEQATALARRLGARLAELVQVEDAPRGVAAAVPPPRSLESAEQWRGRVRAAASAAREGGLDKVVLARGADFEAPAGHVFDARATLWALREAHPRGVCFATAQAPDSVFLGATPEILVQVSGRELSTQAVAGTAPRGHDAEADRALGEALLASSKDRREHAVVADVLQAALAPMCVDLHRGRAPRLIRLPRVQHLETTFSGTLRQAGGVLEIVEQLHPTPSVGGSPRTAAMAWLAREESLDRGLYAGPVGYVTGAGDGGFAVALRSVLLHPGGARAFAGAGIVAASDPEAEWQETELKLRTVREALRLRTV